MSATTTGAKVLRLADLREEVGEVELLPSAAYPKGRRVPVRPFTQRMYDLWAAITAAPEGPEADAQAKALVALCLPDATPEELGDLTPGQMYAVTEAARGRLELVLAALAAARPGGPEGNAAAPAATQVRRRRSR